MTLTAGWGHRLEAVSTVLDHAETAYQAALSARDAMVSELRSAGFTQAETASLLGISNQRVSQIERAGWKGAPVTSASERLQTAREAYGAAKTAQKLREENYAMGYKAETAVFYGERDTPISDEQEDRIKWAGFHQAKEAAS